MAPVRRRRRRRREGQHRGPRCSGGFGRAGSVRAEGASATAWAVPRIVWPRSLADFSMKANASGSVMMFVRQQAFRPVDGEARLPALGKTDLVVAGRGEFRLERLGIGETAEGDLGRGQELLTLERLHQVGLRACVTGPLDEVALAEHGRMTTAVRTEEWIAATAWSPSIPGILMSKMTRSGCRLRTSSTASSPRPVEPTTSKPSSTRISHRSSRTTVGSLRRGAMGGGGGGGRAAGLHGCHHHRAPCGREPIPYQIVPFICTKMPMLCGSCP